MSAPAGVVDGLLAGRYRLTARLAAGAMGEVWRARDLMLDRDVAVKTLRPELADDEVVRARFRAEARSTGRLAHPGIASVYDVGEDDDGRAWLVLELVEGESLQAVLRRTGRLGPERTLDVLAQAAAALQAAHDSGVVHRDVKPGNLLVREDGVVKVTDFGIASVAGTARLTGTGQIVGTAAYLSPEQAGGGSATPASDLYALGVVAHECLSGTVPFAFDAPVAVLLAHLRTDPPPLPDDVPPPLRALVLRLLAKDPADRPASGGEVVAAADAVRAGLRGGGSPGPAATPAPGLTAVPRGTAVLPSADHAAPASSGAPSSAGQAAGLSGRPGQRWAVRATALLLGLLAVALGLRESSGKPGRPAPSTPSATTAPTTAPASPRATAPDDAAGAPVVPAPAAPVPEGGQPARSQEQPAAPAPQQEAPQQEGAPPAQGEPAQEQAEEVAEPEDGAEQAREPGEEAAENGGGNGNAGGGNGNGGGGGGGNGGGNGNGRGNGGKGGGG